MSEGSGPALAPGLPALLLDPAPDALRALSNWLREHAPGLGVSAEAIDLLDLCASEALANVLEHGHAARVSVRLGLVDGAGALQLVDDGPAFDPLGLPAPQRPPDLAHARAGGLGVHLMRSLMAQCHYRRGPEGNVLTLVAPC